MSWPLWGLRALAVVRKYISKGSVRMQAAFERPLGRHQADGHDIPAHALPPNPVILFLSRPGEFSGNDILRPDLSVYRQTDDSSMVKRELFLFRPPLCVYAE
jgi:hypothetical protein